MTNVFVLAACMAAVAVLDSSCKDQESERVINITSLKRVIVKADNIFGAEIDLSGDSAIVSIKDATGRWASVSMDRKELEVSWTYSEGGREYHVSAIGGVPTQLRRTYRDGATSKVVEEVLTASEWRQK